MASTLNDTRAIGAAVAAEETESSAGLSYARYCALEEAVGLIFGVMTVAYIVLSLAGLASNRSWSPGPGVPPFEHKRNQYRWPRTVCWSSRAKSPTITRFSDAASPMAEPSISRVRTAESSPPFLTGNTATVPARCPSPGSGSVVTNQGYAEANAFSFESTRKGKEVNGDGFNA